MYVSATLSGRPRVVGILVLSAVALMAFGWVVHRDDYGPHSVTIIGISEPGAGAGLYNGLRAKSIPAVTALSRIEEGPIGGGIYSLAQTDSVQ